MRKLAPNLNWAGVLVHRLGHYKEGFLGNTMKQVMCTGAISECGSWKV